MVILNQMDAEPTDFSEEPSTNNHSKDIDLSLLISQTISQDEPSKVYKLAPALAKVSVAKYAEYKQQLREHFKRRLSTTDLDRAVKEARKGQHLAQMAQRKKQKHARPIVEIGGQLRDVVQSALDTLVLANSENPYIFVQSGRLVTIHFSEKNGPAITPFALNTLRYSMTRVADYVSIHSTAEDVVAVPVDPPLDVVRVILEGMNPVEYPFPPLAGITQLPIIRPDGSLHTTPGYDTVTEQMYIPGDLLVPAIPEVPGAADVEASKEMLNYWLSGFPFENEASKAAIIAIAITAVIRSVVEGQVPLTLLDAPKQGSGKTILAQAIGILATGRIVPTNAPTNDEEEWRKKTLTWLLTSPAVIIIDNITHRLESSSLNATLTSPFIEDRELGSNTLIHVPNRALWFASGNNINTGDDTARRCIKCRLDARMERPHTRDAKSFPIPGGVNGFFKWTLEHRAKLVAAILTLARNWYAQGKPEAEVTPLGNFEEWTTILGGILQAASIPGFLVNLNEEDGSSSIDEVSAEWASFFEAIHAVYQDTPFTSAELAKRMIVGDEEAENLQETLPFSITKHFSTYKKSQGEFYEFPTHMGRAFGTRKGQVYNDLRLEVIPGKGKNKTQWKVSTLVSEPAPATQSNIIPGPWVQSEELPYAEYEDIPHMFDATPPEEAYIEYEELTVKELGERYGIDRTNR